MLGRFIYKFSLPIILVTLILTIISIYLLPYLEREVNFESFMLEGEPDFIKYKEYSQQMGSYENTFILAIHNHPTIFDSAFLQKIKILQHSIDTAQIVTNTLSLLDLKRYTRLLTGNYLQRFYIQSNHPERFKRDSLLILEDSLLTRHFVSTKNDCASIIFRVEDEVSLSAVDSLVKNIDLTTSGLNIDETHLMGRKYVESEFLKIMTSEFKTSLLLSLLFIVLTLWWLYRSVAGVILPVICVTISLIMLYAYLVLFDRPLTILSNLFPTIVLIIGISDVIHISSKFNQESIKGENQVKAMDKTLKEIGLTTLINTLTTAIGFLTLLFMSMKAMQSFGIDAAVGLIIAWINAVLLLPALMVRFDLQTSFSKTNQIQSIQKILSWIVGVVFRKPKVLGWIFGIIILISSFGIIRINTNNLILTRLPEHNRLLKDFTFFDQEAGGGRVLEIIIEPKADYHVYDLPVIKNIARLEKYLIDSVGLSKVISPVLPIKWLHRSASRQNDWVLPTRAADFRIYKQQLITNQLTLPVAITDNTGSTGRLIGRQKDYGRITTAKKISAMKSWIRQNLDNEIVNFTVTGSDYLMDLGHQRRIENTVSGFILEVLVIALIIGLLYKSGSMVLITLVVNLIPIIVVAGFMGYTGIELRGSNTIIFAIGYVIAADNTLHFINRYKLELKKVFSVTEAVRNTLLFTGKPIIITSLILLGGFMILLHSSFGDVFYHGLLVSVIIMAALLTDLFLTPVMLIWYHQKEKPDQFYKKGRSM